MEIQSVGGFDIGQSESFGVEPLEPRVRPEDSPDLRARLDDSLDRRDSADDPSEPLDPLDPLVDRSGPAADPSDPLEPVDPLADPSDPLEPFDWLDSDPALVDPAEPDPVSAAAWSDSRDPVLAGLPAELSLRAQPEPLKWIEGRENAFFIGAPHTGQAAGPSSWTECLTSISWPQAVQM
jgi:hypothetical protein